MFFICIFQLLQTWFELEAASLPTCESLFEKDYVDVKPVVKKDVKPVINMADIFPTLKRQFFVRCIFVYDLNKGVILIKFNS